MKRFKAAKAAALLLCFALCFALAACSGARRIYKSEIAACLPALVEQSKVLNEIYFGDGFPPRGDCRQAKPLGMILYHFERRLPDGARTAHYGYSNHI